MTPLAGEDALIHPSPASLPAITAITFCRKRSCLSVASNVYPVGNPYYPELRVQARSWELLQLQTLSLVGIRRDQMIRLKACLIFLFTICLAGIPSGCGGVSGNSTTSGSWSISVNPTGGFSPGEMDNIRLPLLTADQAPPAEPFQSPTPCPASLQPRAPAALDGLARSVQFPAPAPIHSRWVPAILPSRWSSKSHKMLPAR